MELLAPDFNRIVTTLSHDEPDRVPLAELSVDPSVMSQFLGREVTGNDLASQVEFWRCAGYDYIPLSVGMMQPGTVTQESPISKVLKQILLKDMPGQENGEAWNLERCAWIHDEDDFEKFPWHEAGKLDFSKFYDVQPYLPKGMKIVAVSGKIFTLTWMLMGFENFCVSLAQNPQFVERVLKAAAEIQLSSLQQIASIPNVAAVWVVDDLAFGTGPFVSPRALRLRLFPWYEEFIKICRSHHLYTFFHSDGLLGNLVEDLIGLGVDALHPIDPTCMDIEEVKKRFGRRISIFGNVSNELLMNGAPADVSALTKKLLKTIAPGGGYCLGSGNSVPSWARIENYQAMVSTALRFGRYPIQVS